MVRATASPQRSCATASTPRVPAAITTPDRSIRLSRAAVEDAARPATRRGVHQPWPGRVDAERHRGSVHDDVDPEHLDGGERWGQPGHGSAQERQDRPDVGGQLEPTNLTTLSKIERPSRIARTMVAKLSSVRIMSAGFLGDLGAGDAHGHADVGRPEGGGVVDAVAGHGDDVAGLLQRPHQLDLVLGGDPGEDPDVPDSLRQFVLGHRVEVGAGDDVAADAELAGDRGGGLTVVPSDHFYRDPGAAAECDGVLDLRSGRIGDADEAEEGQPVEAFPELVCPVETGLGRGEHAPALRPQLRDVGGNRVAPAVVQRHLASRGEDGGAALQQDVGRP